MLATAGLSGSAGPTVADAGNLGRVIARVLNGGGMPAFKDTLSTQQINDVSAYVAQRVAGSP